MILEKPTQHITTDVKRPLPNDKDQPPPYVSNAVGPSTIPRPVVAAASPQTLGSVTMNSVIFQPTGVQRVNNYWLYSKQTPISGTFIIDPSTSPTHFGDCHRRVRMPAERRKKIFFKEKHTIPAASFHTRHSSITLNLSVEGTSSRKAFISTRSRHGKIHVNVTSLQPKKHFLLEASTRHGMIIVFLPPTFNGLIQIHKRHSIVEFLPEFARGAKVVQGSDKGSLIHYGHDNTDVSVVEQDLVSDFLDHCLIGSRTGRIVIGISGVDHYEPPTVKGVLRKLKEMWAE